ncbi:hypothetical protein C9374_013720 [Naegleria lovaniensis]|uniref:Uncharacterized protein n=1 Tax=Naegleria lovaniensis TaxID=51637 RepID=A0AA88GB69_NAELO|nr:uncharacterized protein C9374_013720 [Naegleria lovaniensis]KAG2370920.1 hypothetical protein C9374_013720 [Naegleria lovaniensis]
MPNVWTDKVFISKCDHRHVVLESCAIPLAAFLVSITFQEYDTLKTLVDFSTHNHQLAVSPFVSDKVQPFVYFQVMDDYLDDLEFDTENFEWTDRDFGKGGEWIPKFFNAGAYAEEYSYRASFIDESREWKVTKVYNSYYV